MHEATALATEYTHQAIETAIPIGKGFGPLNHMHSLTIRSVSRYVFPALCNFNRRVQISTPQTNSKQSTPFYSHTHSIYCRDLERIRRTRFREAASQGNITERMFLAFYQVRASNLSLGLYVDLYRQDYLYLRYYARAYG